MEITKDTKIGDLLNYDQSVAYILMLSGMHCVGCAISTNETLEEACAVHGLDAEDILMSIQDYLAAKKAHE